MRAGKSGGRKLWLLTRRSAILVAVATSIAACGSSSATGAPVSTSGASSFASSGSSSGSGTGAHTSAINVCGLLDESSMSTLVGFPAKDFGPGDPVARVPIADRATTNANGAAIRIAYCGYWETGVKPELSRDVSVEITQGDPAKPGSWSVDAAHGQFTVLQTFASAKQPQAVGGLGDEAYVTTTTGAITMTARSGDLVVQVEADTPPGATSLTVDTLKTVSQAVLAKL